MCTGTFPWDPGWIFLKLFRDGPLNAGQGIQAGNRTPNLPRIPNSSWELAQSPSFFLGRNFFLLAPPSPPGFSFPFPLGNIGLTHFPGSWGWICIIPPARRDAGAADAPEQMMLRETSEREREGQKYPSFYFYPHKSPLSSRVFYPSFPPAPFPGSFLGLGSWVFHGASQDLPNSFPVLRFFSRFCPLSCLAPGLLQLPKAPAAAPGCWR